MIFKNRADAARRLAERLSAWRGRNPLVLGIPRGGVLMAADIADALEGDLDVVLVRKLRAPGAPEFALGAITESGDVVFSDPRVSQWVDPDYLQAEKQEALRMIAERRALYTPYRPAVRPTGRVVIVVDDGIATGATMRAALRSLAGAGAARRIVAAGVAPPETARELGAWADEVVLLETPDDFAAVSQFYEDFPQVSDDEVIEALRRRGVRTGAA